LNDYIRTVVHHSVGSDKLLKELKHATYKQASPIICKELV